jgi:hypothetical protein
LCLPSAAVPSQGCGNFIAEGDGLGDGNVLPGRRKDNAIFLNVFFNTWKSEMRNKYLYSPQKCRSQFLTRFLILKNVIVN